MTRQADNLVTAFAQMLGGIVAAGIVRGLTPGDLGVNCRLSDGMSRSRGLFVEMFGTMFLTLSVLMLAAGAYPYYPKRPPIAHTELRRHR